MFLRVAGLCNASSSIGLRMNESASLLRLALIASSLGVLSEKREAGSEDGNTRSSDGLGCAGVVEARADGSVELGECKQESLKGAMGSETATARWISRVVVRSGGIQLELLQGAGKSKILNSAMNNRNRN